MSTLSLRLPESLHKKVRELTRKDRVSINQFINSAVAEKISTFLTRDYLEERAKRGSKTRFLSALRRVKNRKPESGDEL